MSDSCHVHVPRRFPFVTTKQRDIQRAVNLDLEYPRDAAAKISDNRLGHTYLEVGSRAPIMVAYTGRHEGDRLDVELNVDFDRHASFSFRDAVLHGQQ